MIKRKVQGLFLLIFMLSFFVLFINIHSISAANLGDAFSTDFLIGTGGTAGYNTQGVGVSSMISGIIQTALTFLGVIFLILMIYGGYLWMTARGNDEQSEKAKKTIVAAIVGIVIVLSAYAISYLVISKLGDKALDSSSSAGEEVQ